MKIIAYNVPENRAESEFNNLGDALKFIISRNSNMIGLRLKNNGLKIAIARTNSDTHHGIGIDANPEIDTQVSEKNPVTHIQLYQDTQWLINEGIQIGDIRNLDMRR